MFGYIFPERAHLYMKDFDLYRSFYCGICKSMERQFGQLSRFTVNYDVTFLAILLHNFLGEDISFEKLKCITKPFTKRKNVVGNPLTDDLAALNVILAYYSVYDKVIDDKTLKAKSALQGLKKAKSKAEIRLKGISKIVEIRYENLRALEEKKKGSVDEVSHEFSSLMEECVNFITNNYLSKKVLENKDNVCYNSKEYENVRDNFSHLSYNVGKWIYIIDALDDFDDDVKERKYNLFSAVYNDCESKEQLMEKHGDEIVFTFSTCLNKICESFEKIKFHFNTDFVKNVIYKGMPTMTKGIMRGEQCKKTYTKYLG